MAQNLLTKLQDSRNFRVKNAGVIDNISMLMRKPLVIICTAHMQGTLGQK